MLLQRVNNDALLFPGEKMYRVIFLHNVEQPAFFYLNTGINKFILFYLRNAWVNK